MRKYGPHFNTGSHPLVCWDVGCLVIAPLWGGRFQMAAKIGNQNIRVRKKGFSRLRLKICSE